MSANKIVFYSSLVFLLFFCQNGFSQSEQESFNADSNPETKKFTLGYVEWMPFSGRNEKGEAIGMDIEILKEAFKRIKGYTPIFQYVEWKDSMLNVLQETLDSSWVCYLTQKRMKAFDYTTFYNYETLHVFVSKNSKLKFSKIADLEGKKVMLAFGYSAGEEYDNNRNIVKMTARTDELALLELAKGNIDAVITGELVALYYMNKHNLYSKIRMLNRPVGLFPLHGLVKKSRNFNFLKEFEIAMVQLQRDGVTEDIRMNWKKKLGAAE